MDADIMEREVRALVVDGLGAPECTQERYRFVGARAALAHGCVDRVEVGCVLAADAHAEHDAPTRGTVEIRDLLRDDRGWIQRQEERGGADCNRAALFDEPREPHHGFRSRVRGGDVTADPDAAPAASKRSTSSRVRGATNPIDTRDALESTLGTAVRLRSARADGSCTVQSSPNHSLPRDGRGLYADGMAASTTAGFDWPTWSRPSRSRVISAWVSPWNTSRPPALARLGAIASAQHAPRSPLDA
jgi:hypothetical protein